MPTEIRIQSGDDFAKLKARAENVPVLGRIVARTIESQAQRAFLEQKLGEHVWPERYPSQEDPFVNIAALVSWTNKGGSILSRFFDRRPALMGQGTLSRSISSRVTGNTVEVGSALDYAGTHQWGGRSMQAVTETAKRTIAHFIGEKRVNGKWIRNPRIGSRQKENREKYWFKLFPLLGMSALDTEVHPRPFLGITEQAEAEIIEGIESYVAGGR